MASGLILPSIIIGIGSAYVLGNVTDEVEKGFDEDWNRTYWIGKKENRIKFQQMDESVRVENQNAPSGNWHTQKAHSYYNPNSLYTNEHSSLKVAELKQRPDVSVYYKKW